MNMSILISACATGGIVLGIWIILALSGGSKRAKPPVAPPVPEPEKPYTYADYLRDLHDKDMSISDILDKCGGVIPSPPPPEPEVPKPPELSDAVKAKMALFEQMSRGMAKPTVPPPVPVLTIKAWQVPCDQCRPYFGGERCLDMIPAREQELWRLELKNCKKCGGTGVLYIQDGRR